MPLVLLSFILAPTKIITNVFTNSVNLLPKSLSAHNKAFSTRERYPKRELIRIVSTDGVISIDETGKKNGKGCYLKKDKDIILKAKEKKINTI